MDPSLMPFFRPRGVVLVGASHDPGKLGYGVAANLVQSGYQGAIPFRKPKRRPLDTPFLPPPSPAPGDVAFISPSGAICAAVTDWATGQGFGLSLLVSLGNQADLTETDMLAPVAEDAHTRVLTLYLEGIGDGRRFVEEAGAGGGGGRPPSPRAGGGAGGGRRAAASHTGALAGQEVAYDAAFHRAGVIRAETSEEMFDWSRALAWCPLPAGPDVAVLTNAGGPGVIAADAVDRCRLPLAALQ